jgi:uncharacterized membrane protein
MMVISRVKVLEAKKMTQHKPIQTIWILDLRLVGQQAVEHLTIWAVNKMKMVISFLHLPSLQFTKQK